MPGRPCNVCITPLGSVGNTQTVLTYSPRINLLLPVSDSNNLWGNWGFHILKHVCEEKIWSKIWTFMYCLYFFRRFLCRKKRYSILKLWKCENKSPMLRGWRCWHPYLEYPPLIKFQYFPQIFHLPIISLSVSILQRLAKLLNVKGWGKDQVFQIRLWIYHYWDFLWGWFQ